MAEYYLISQLPSLDGIGESSPLPITEERFLELCSSFLSKKALNEIKNLTLCPNLDFEKVKESMEETRIKAKESFNNITNMKASIVRNIKAKDKVQKCAEPK